MLQQMRKFARSWISGIFLVGLAATFGLWGIADVFQGNADTSIATVGGVKIPAADFQRDFNNLRNRAAQQSGGQLSPELARVLGQKILQKQIDDTALDQAGASRSLMASDEQVADHHSAGDCFQRSAGLLRSCDISWGARSRRLHRGSPTSPRRAAISCAASCSQQLPTDSSPRRNTPRPSSSTSTSAAPCNM